MRIADSSQHTAIVGANGTGKTISGLWILSLKDITERPYVIYNWKNDKAIDAIPHAHHIGMNELPIRPGVYIVHPHPEQKLEVEDQMWAIWEKENIGVMIDEGYMIGNNNPAFRALLTQGRSKEIPIIVLSQRPVWMDRFVFSEAQFFQVFRLQHKKDRQNVQEFIPFDISERLPPYHSYYYDVNENTFTKLKPVPSEQEIMRTFERRLGRVRRTI